MRERATISSAVHPILYFDAAPVLTADDVGGFGKARSRRRGMLVAATLTGDGELRLFRGGDCEELAAHLGSAKMVVGYNCLRFDYELIRGRTLFFNPPTTDLMIVQVQREFRIVSFDKAVRKYLGCEPAQDIEALRIAALGDDWGRSECILKERLELFARLHRKLFPNFQSFTVIHKPTKNPSQNHQP